MKYFQNLLTFAICLLFIQSSQANIPSDQNPNYTYTIHLGAFDKAELSDFDDIRLVGYVYGYQLRDGLMQVFLGGYDSRNTAKQVLQIVKSNGYPDAYVMRKPLDEGDDVYTVQIGIQNAGQKLDWGRYLQAGHLYLFQNNNELRILNGQYDDLATAERRVAQLKRMGFIDAAAKTVNTVQLIEVNDFQTGGATADPIVAVIETSKGAEKEEDVLPESYDVLFKKSKNVSKGGGSNIPKDIPQSYEGNSTRIITPPTKKKKVEMPNIRVKVKRTSALELQKVLKAEGVYNSGLDGYYGKGTAKGYKTIKTQNHQVKKYLMLSKMMEENANADAGASRLQKIINNLFDNSNDGAMLLKAERSPLAKAYRAYVLFENEGAQDEVNRLMNAAIQQAFKGKKLKNAPPFDYNSTYAYKDLGQLLKHLGYIHTAAPDAEVPCWIFSQHASEAANAFASNSGNIGLQNCGGDFMSWEETKLLKTIAEDLDPAYGSKSDQQALYASKRAKLFVAPLKMNADEAKDILTWHKSVWMALDEWGNSDPVHDQRVTALKVAYFQSQVRLEDYFMNKGFKYKEAKPLAMCVLQTIVGTHFVNYLKG